MSDTATSSEVPKLYPHETMRIRAAAYHARKRYPGPVGELVSQELLAWSEFGFRFGHGGIIHRLVQEMMSVTPMEECG